MARSLSAQLPKDVVFLYPGNGLVAQRQRLMHARTDCRVRISRARRLPEIRAAIERAVAVVVDATGDHPQAVDAMLQAVARRGRDSVAVYTEHMHDGLELFVRMHGVLLLLGPMDGSEWDGFWEGRLPATTDEQPSTLPLWHPRSDRPRRAA